jgi:hypothetical protein
MARVIRKSNCGRSTSDAALLLFCKALTYWFATRKDSPSHERASARAIETHTNPRLGRSSSLPPGLRASSRLCPSGG